MSYGLENTALYTSDIDIGHDEAIPVDSLKTLNRDESILVDSQGFATLNRNESIPIDSEGLDTLNRLEVIPIAALLGGVTVNEYASIPIDSTGVEPNKLLLRWSVRQPLDTPFSIRWNVVQRGLIARLTLRWTVRQRIMPFSIRWNVIPDTLSPLIANDVQKPFGTITKTP